MSGACQHLAIVASVAMVADTATMCVALCSRPMCETGVTADAKHDDKIKVRWLVWQSST